ncbi:hypothetical protein CTAYLR_000389 [Chrysophaeum taylorii]|uniref:N-acetyltransferase domain-containing protein n=1 Tax=Chrysophaeum taylorii TaxID=2483200 RepID=A0AAD7UHK8_9STRA|nr:hypothetical protein CTAYLR_000389 [Chrysophaeum taylorii]
MDCAACTFRNEQGAAACAVCGHSFVVVVTNNNNNNNKTCGNCGFDANSPEAKACVACDADFRRCDICTFEAAGPTCAMCEAWWCGDCGTCTAADAACACAILKLVWDFDAKKLGATISKVPTERLAPIVDDPAAFLAKACGVIPDDPLPSVEEPPPDDDGAVVVHDAPAAAAKEEEETAWADQELAEWDRARDLCRTKGRRRAHREWVCAICETTLSTRDLLEAHVLVQHIDHAVSMMMSASVRIMVACVIAVAGGLRPLTSFRCMDPWVQRELRRREAFEGVALRTPNDKEDPFVLGIMEARDVNGVGKVIAESFSSLVVSREGYAAWENAALDGVASLVNAYDVAEYSLGLRVRCGDRLEKPDALPLADHPGSLVFAVARCSGVDAVAAVELRLREADGTAPGPFLFLDRFRLPKAAEHRPYLSNLCVSPRCRRRGIAGTLLSAAEFVAGALWGYDSIFLHVHKSNRPALDLYSREGYTPIQLLQDADAPHHETTISTQLVYHYKPLRADAPKPENIGNRILAMQATRRAS